eukprot:gnl/MRDRNA2_/MRDRNA2_54686_c0_seq1.p1 gnl/MRDRNA2_/MRDRNA2_54686_c0~~gnl/MRDRNA2_/MRDRNA2_54686_c0_seq1.p1  ORF type:complete len:188 (-),score=39.83 gnl/MRDRNA2_/MRDRNA2_54686_c0_seq1:105-668(-)
MAAFSGAVRYSETPPAGKGGRRPMKAKDAGWRGSLEIDFDHSSFHWQCKYFNFQGGMRPMPAKPLPTKTASLREASGSSVTVEEDSIVLLGTEVDDDDESGSMEKTILDVEVIILCWLEPDGMGPGGFIPKFATKTEVEEREFSGRFMLVEQGGLKFEDYDILYPHQREGPEQTQQLLQPEQPQETQ